jgi:hypothetical protein
MRSGHDEERMDGTAYRIWSWTSTYNTVADFSISFLSEKLGFLYRLLSAAFVGFLRPDALDVARGRGP